VIRHRVDFPSARRRHTALRLRTDSSSTGAMGPTAAHRPTRGHISAHHRATKDIRARHPNDRAPKTAPPSPTRSRTVGDQTRCTGAPRVHRVPRPESECTSRRSRVTSRTVTPLPHQSAASRPDKPSSTVIASNAQPAHCSASRTPHRVRRVQSTRQPPTPPAGVPGRCLLCATAWPSSAERRAACLTDC
jgi:hypothetical protein